MGYLKKIYVYSSRIDLSNNQTGGMLAFAWFVFDKSYQGYPTIEWL